MTKKEIIQKSLGFSLLIYFLLLFSLFFIFPTLIPIMIENRINLDDLLMGIIFYTPFFYIFLFSISYIFFRRNKTVKDKFDKFCIFLGKYILLIILTFIFVCILFFYFVIFYFSDVSLKGFFICENDFTFSRDLKSYGGFFITDRGVCVNEYTCEKLEGFAECEKLDEDKYYSRAVVKEANKNNFDFYFVGDDTYFIKDNDIAIFKHTDGDYLFLIVKNVDVETFQYLGGKYSKDKNHVYYKNEIINADPETFIYEKGGGKSIGKGKDKNGIWIKGILKQ